MNRKIKLVSAIFIIFVLGLSIGLTYAQTTYIIITPESFRNSYYVSVEDGVYYVRHKNGTVTSSISINIIHDLVSSLTYGGKVEFESGSYVFTNALQILNHNVKLIGESRDTVNFIFSGAIDGIQITNVRGVELENIVIYHGYTGDSGSVGLRIGGNTTHHVSKVRIINCKIEGYWLIGSLLWETVYDSVFDHCHLGAASKTYMPTAIKLDTDNVNYKPNNNEFYHCFGGAAGTFINVVYGEGTKISNSNFDTCDVGITIQDDICLLTSNWLENCGIAIAIGATANGTTLINNVFSGGITTKILNDGINTIVLNNAEYRTQINGVIEAKDGDWINFGVTFANAPQTIICMAQEGSGYFYVIQANTIQNYRFQISIWNVTASALQTTNITVMWVAIYEP